MLQHYQGRTDTTTEGKEEGWTVRFELQILFGERDQELPTSQCLPPRCPRAQEQGIQS